MNIVKRIDQYDENNVIFFEPIKNNIMNDGNFIRIIYSTHNVVLNGIYLLVTLNDITCEKYYAKYKCNFNITLNKDIIDNIKIIEEDIIKKYKSADKLPQYKIYEQLKNGNFKLFTDIDIYLRQHQYTLVDFITFRDDYIPIISSLKQNAHYAPCGDAIYVLNDKCETLQKSIKKGLILNWLGYKGIAENIMTDAGVEKEDVKQLLKGKSVNASSFFNRFVKNMTPPLVHRLIKKIVWRLKRV